MATLREMGSGCLIRAGRLIEVKKNRKAFVRNLITGHLNVVGVAV